jgi:excisionase family DNA binding protein
MNKDLYTVQEAMELLGGISRNTIYNLMRDGRLASVPIGRRRFIPAHAIDDFIKISTTTESPSVSARRSRRSAQIQLNLIPARPPRTR